MKTTFNREFVATVKKLKISFMLLPYSFSETYIKVSYNSKLMSHYCTLLLHWCSVNALDSNKDLMSVLVDDRWSCQRRYKPMSVWGCWWNWRFQMWLGRRGAQNSVTGRLCTSDVMHILCAPPCAFNASSLYVS